MLTFTFPLDLNELMRARRVVWSRSPWEWLQRAFPPVLLVSTVWAFWMRGWSLVDTFGQSWVIVLFLVALYFLAPWVREQAIRRQYRNPTVPGPQTIVFTDKGLEMAGPITTVALSWEAILKVVEVRDFFLFYVSDELAHYLPRHAVSGPDADSLRMVIARHIGSRARLFSISQAAV